MNIDEFLVKLVDGDYEIKNMAFRENDFKFIDLISNLKSKLVIAVSSSFFNENIQLFSNMENINNVQSIFSFPIFKDLSNLILITFNPEKNSEEFLLIDESDSSFHKSEVDNISDELANELINIFNNPTDSDCVLNININSLFKNTGIPEVKSSDLDDILDLYVDDNSEGYNEKAMANTIQDVTLDLKGKELLAFQSDEATEDDDELLDLMEEEKKHIKRKVISNKLVDGLLKLKEERFNQQDEISNMRIPLYEGLMEITSANVLKELTYSKKRSDPQDLLKKNGKKLIDGDVEFRKLGAIANLKNIDEKNSEDTILIATCKLCDSKLVHYNYDVEDFEGEIYIELNNVSEDVDDEYLYEYLNSANGLSDLLYYSKGYNYLSPKLINSVQIPIPPIEVQKEIVKATKDAKEFFRTVDLLKNEFNSNILDYKHISQSIKSLRGDIEIDSNTSEVTELSRSWRHAYQGLIWPLAISYLSATKGGFELVEKKDNYLKLFEFTAAFNAIILLSGLPDEVYLNNFDNIWTDESLNLYTSMSFGKWVILCQNIANIYNNNNFSSKLDEDLFDEIKSNKFLKVLDESKNERNKEFHEAISNSYEAEKTIEVLDRYLDIVFDILDIYSNYKFIYTTGRLENRNQKFIHEVILLNGPCAQPIYDKISFDYPLQSESLYLYNPKNNKKLLIKDSFMKFKAMDDNKKHWALFIYNGCNKSKTTAFYKCFQSKEKNLKKRISSLKHEILL